MTFNAQITHVDPWEELFDKADDEMARNLSEHTGNALRAISHFRRMNDRLGGALGQLREQPQDIQGRDEEIALLHAVLERPKTPVALLLAQAGTGKTALVEEFAKQLNSGKYATHTHYRYMLVNLRVGVLASLGHSMLQSALASLFDDMLGFERLVCQVLGDPNVRIVLFIDEVHMIVTIFGPGTKIGGDVIKDALARSPIRVIAATTRREYDSTIAVDKPLAERFKQIELRELGPDIVKDIARNWWSKVAPDCPYPSDEVIGRMIEANAMYRTDSAEPRKSLDILEDLVSYSRRTGKVADMEFLHKIFKDRYSISLGFTVDAEKVYGEVERRIKGQPFALYTLRRLINSMLYQLDPTSNKPRLTALFTGSTGVGKAVVDKTLTPIITRDGRLRYIPHGGLRVGDRVPNRYGEPVKVVGVFKQPVAQCYRVIIEDGRHLEVNGEHLFAVYDPATLSKQNPDFEVISVNEMLRRGLFYTNESGFKGGPKFYIPNNGGVKTKAVSYKVAPYDAAATFEPTVLIDKFRDYGAGSLAQRWDFARGLFDTFGYVGPSPAGGGLRVAFVHENKVLCRRVAHLLTTLGIRSSMSYVGEDCDPKFPRGFHVIVYAGIADKQLLFTRGDLKSNFSDYVANHGVHAVHPCAYDYVPIVKIVPLGRLASTCIMVDDPEHLYQAGFDHIVTHNTETVKAISDTLYPGDNVILNINMPDYKSVEHEPAFRKRIGEFVRHTPNAIILLDEFEKAHESVRDSMLTILDEGLITFEVINREGFPEVNTVSLRNSIVFATTNAGADIFANDAKFSMRNLRSGRDIDDVASRAEIDALAKGLRQDLQAEGFRPEMLGRFNRIIPYRALTRETLLEIAQIKLDDLVRKFRDVSGIELVFDPPQQWDPQSYDCFGTDVAVYVTFERAKADDSNSGGARAIVREIESNVYDSIVDARIANPECDKFRVYVSKDSPIYVCGADPSEGGVIVEPIFD